MAKIVFFSDTHLGIDMPLKPKKNRRRRGYDYFKNFEYVLQHAMDSNSDLVIHGGDLFDTPNVHQNIVDYAYEKLLNVAEKGIPIVICPGNHERSILPPSLYLNHPNIFVFAGNQTFQFNLQGEQINISGFPFVRRDIKTNFEGICSELVAIPRKPGFEILLMHQAIEGAVVGPQRFRFRHGQDVVQIKDIPNFFDLILSGHIHPTQQLKTLAGKTILYPGSTERTAFAEKDETKGFYEMEIIKSHIKQSKFLPLETRPMEIVILNGKSYNKESLKDEITNQISKFPTDAVVQIQCKNKDVIPLLKVQLLDNIFPATMNYQISGINYFKK